MPLSDWSEKQFLALTAGIVGGILLIMAGVLYYVYSHYRDLVAEIEQVSLQTKKKEKDAEKLEEVEKRLEEANQRKQEIQGMIPDAPDVEAFVRQITEQVKASRLRITKIDVEEQKPGGGGRKPAAATPFEPLLVKLDLEGGYHDFGQFINRVEERMERIVAVKEFKIKGFKNGMVLGQRQLDIALELETYSNKQ